MVFTLIQRLLCRLVVLGRENIPTDRPFILVVNHLSTADIGIVFVGFPNEPWRYFAGEKWAHHWLWGPLMSWLGVIFVNRGEFDRRALREALASLAEEYLDKQGVANFEMQRDRRVCTVENAYYLNKPTSIDG